jgi:hypothetical protein
MTGPVTICSSCQTPIAAGALYCQACGASSPTEISATVPEGVGSLPPQSGAAQRASLSAPQIEERRSRVQTALGAGFEVTGLIGRGGFGEVWAALDKELGRVVAVKVLRPEISSSPEFRTRFRREARAIARLRHPGIVPIYHVGESGGLVYFIMPMVEGTTLKDALMQPGGLTGDEAVRILIEAAGALHEAHARGIVHRDLKPENIMLEGPQRRALLMDFGVAKVEEPGGEGLTETDSVLGSPEYMSPEQATARQLDARSDIYSLGVVAYRMLSGRLPFDADTPREVLAHHILTPPEPLAQFTTVPESVSDAVMRCLAKGPEDRWQTAAAFASALAAAVPAASGMAAAAAAAPVVGERRQARNAHLRQRYRRRRWAGKVLGVVLVLALVVAPWPIARLRREHAWTVAAAGIAVLYQRGTDSVRALSDGFISGDLSAPQFADARGELLASVDARIDEGWGDAVDDSAKWPEAARSLVREAAGRLDTAGLGVASYRLRLSDVPGCPLTDRGDTLRLADRVPGDNCWWAAEGARALGAPLEYAARFRVRERLRDDAGLGLAWCRSDGDCRIAFLWSAGTAVWGSHRPHSGLAVIQTGRREALNPGEHRLRVRFQDGVLRCWLDGGLVLERRTSAESVYFEQPGSFHLVVQNGGVELDGPDALVGVGQRRPAP